MIASNTFSLLEQDSLVVIDVQNDFCLKGALPVPGTGNAYIKTLNSYIDTAYARGARIIFTKDWHPHGHCSFRSQGGAWPPHCVAETKGAQLHPLLNVPETAIYVEKGTKTHQEEYSGFDTDKMQNLPILAGDIYLVGVALEYCVATTAIAAQSYLSKNGSVYVIKEGVKSITQDEKKILQFYQKLAKEPRIQVVDREGGLDW